MCFAPRTRGFSRALLRQLMFHCLTCEDVGLVLDCSVACVVHIDEDEKIPDGGGGWDRYEIAREELAAKQIEFNVYSRSGNQAPRETVNFIGTDVLQSLQSRSHLYKAATRLRAGVFQELSSTLEESGLMPALDATTRALLVEKDGIRWIIRRKKQTTEFDEVTERFVARRIQRGAKEHDPLTADEVCDLIKRSSSNAGLLADPTNL